MSLQIDLQNLFYLLLRDATTGGALETIVRQIEDRKKSGLIPQYSNEYLEGYSLELASRLLMPAEKGKTT